MVNVQQAEYRGEYRVWLRFNAGAEGEVDLRRPPHRTGVRATPRPGDVRVSVLLEPGDPNHRVAERCRLSLPSSCETS